MFDVLLFSDWCQLNAMFADTRVMVVSWYFEPSQPQRITSGLKTMLSLSPFFFFFLLSMQVIKPQIIQKQKISPDTNVQKTYTSIKQKNNKIRRNSPFGIAPIKKAHKARTCWYRGLFRRFINTRLKKKYKKVMDRSNK